MNTSVGWQQGRREKTGEGLKGEKQATGVHSSGKKGFNRAPLPHLADSTQTQRETVLAER